LPAANPFALALMLTCTLVLAPPASVPLLGDTLNQLAVALAVQLKFEPPELVRPYRVLAGLNGPPVYPLEASPAVGLTPRFPSGNTTLKLAKRVALPSPLLRLVKPTVPV
jgi:hypothetical protein